MQRATFVLIKDLTPLSAVGLQSNADIRHPETWEIVLLARTTITTMKALYLHSLGVDSVPCRILRTTR